ncbi:MAG: type I methionyl aminopeptidase [Armatimonadetes bacterium]|nr:type I methionyl aminopeptidase [Armatimonadota bacterium]
MIILKTRAEIAKMREAGRILARAQRIAGEMLRPGITTEELDAEIHRVITEAGASPSFLGYNGFPKSACISVNEEVVHGIPGKRKVKEGDIVGIDIGVYLDEYHADAARTFAVGEVTPEVAKLLKVTEDALMLAINMIKPGKRLGDICAAIQKHAESHGFSVVRELSGHGIGQSLHEEPSVPNFGRMGTGPKLKEGMTLAIEPMVNIGTPKVKILSDDWTVVTADGKCSAQFEHTIAIGKNSAEILTLE